ncbi:MAG: RsmB/NOP family class I SAM-dependent RNA methyltransferase [Rickettsiales bacterium]
MKPAARIAAAIDLLMLINDAWEKGKRTPADGIIGYYFKQRRYIGSKDRGAISERVYFILRNGAALEWWLEKAKMKPSPRLLVLLSLVFKDGFALEAIEELYSGGPQCPMPLTHEERDIVEAFHGKTFLDPAMPKPVQYNYPSWMTSLLEETFGGEFDMGMKALGEEAPVDLRVNTLKAIREQVIAALTNEDFAPEPAKRAPNGIRLKKRGALFASNTFRLGWFEMQDEGSQLVCELVDAKPGQKVIDFCAGAGGKTLAIAARMQGKGRILAWDTSKERLSQMPKRLARAGVNNVQLHLIANEQDQFIKRHKQSADWVLADVPCTGSGTWRRSPDLKWRTTEKDMQEVMALQKSILESAARLIMGTGKLVYATCSLFREENETQIENFLAAHSDFAVEPISEREKYLRLLPHRDHTDGFFAAVLTRKKA